MSVSTTIRNLTAISPFYRVFVICNLANYSRLSKKPLLFKSFTGLKLSEFDSQLSEIELKYSEYEIKCLSKRKERTRTIGAGRYDI